jgi:hypothetical protein
MIQLQIKIAVKDGIFAPDAIRGSDELLAPGRPLFGTARFVGVGCHKYLIQRS